MKEIFIYAWLAGNLGDDLFVQSLCERYPVIQFCVLADKQYKERFSDIKNLKVYSSEERKARIVNKIAGFVAKEEGINGFFRYLVKNSAAVVHIGGSVFTQHEDDWSSFYEADAFLAEKAKDCIRSVVILALIQMKNIIRHIMSYLRNIGEFVSETVILMKNSKIYQIFPGHQM